MEGKNGKLNFGCLAISADQGPLQVLVLARYVSCRRFRSLLDTDGLFKRLDYDAAFKKCMAI